MPATSVNVGAGSSLSRCVARDRRSQQFEILPLFPIGHVRQETADLELLQRDEIIDERIAERLTETSAVPQRRDRLLLLNAFAILLLTILGAAGESLGMDRQLRTSTAKRRVHSLFRQGCLLYDLIPNMPEAALRSLIARFQDLLSQNPTFSQAFGFV